MPGSINLFCKIAHILGMDSLREMQDFMEKILGCVQEREEALSGCGRVIRGVVDYIAAPKANSFPGIPPGNYLHLCGCDSIACLRAYYCNEDEPLDRWR